MTAARSIDRSPARPLALITGAGRGIGAAIADELARRGFDLALLDRQLGDAADALLARLQAQGTRARLFAFDLADVDGHAAVLDEVATWAGAWGGSIGCLVNNAGVPALQRADLLDVQPQAFDQVLDINLRGTFFLTQAVARRMLQQPDAAGTAGAAPRSIVTISSVSAELASVERGEYCLSKAGLGMLTRLYALRLAAAGIAVFEVRPGIIRTPMTEGVAAAYDERIAQGLVPAGRWGQPQDVARAVGALVGGDLGFATGSVVHVDGALSVPRL